MRLDPSASCLRHCTTGGGCEDPLQKVATPFQGEHPLLKKTTHTHTHNDNNNSSGTRTTFTYSTCDVGVLFCSSGTMKVQHSQHDDTTVTGKQIHPVCRACTSVQFKRRNDAMARGSVGVNTYLGFGWGTSTFHFVRKTPSHHITHHHTLQQHQQNG